jgi:3-oxoacyl-[acyl-carrier-protein] synthase II
MRRRVVVTGVGAVTGYGVGWKKLWDGVVAGRSAVRAFEWEGWEKAPVQVAAQIVEESSEKRDEWKSLYWARLALREAMKMSGVGCGAGISGAIGWPGPGEKGKGQDPLKILAKEAELEGERVESLAACAASTHAIAEAFWMIRDGEVDEMVAGGADGRANPGGMLGYDRLGALARGFREKSEEACQPFGLGRSGFVVGEGAGFLVLEEREKARARGANILAEVRGAAVGCDAWRATDPREDAEEAIECVKECLEDGGISEDEVDGVVAHGTGTVANDRAEAKMLGEVFGQRSPWVIAPKSRIGHLSMACGAVESVLAVQSIAEDLLPSTLGKEWRADPECSVRVVKGAGKRGLKVVLKPSFGFGGQNACLVFVRA